MNTEEFAKRLAQMLEVDIAPADLRADATLFEEWGLDSLQAFQLVIATEALAGAMVPPPEIPEMYTVADAYDYYVSLRGDTLRSGRSG